MAHSLQARFREALPAVDFCSLRQVRSRDEHLAVRQNVPEPMSCTDDEGAMVTVVHRGGMGYAATSDLSLGGLRRAIETAQRFAAMTAGRSVFDFGRVPMPASVGRYRGPEVIAWDALSLAAKFELLRDVSGALKIDPRICDWHASLWHTRLDTAIFTSSGGCVEQSFSLVAPALAVTASDKGDSQTRSLGSLRGTCRQGGLEVLDHCGFRTAGRRVAAQAIELLLAPDCPIGRLDLLLAPDQMMLQIHESIGHPLEIDRILGDERNYAGTSFVTPDMFGTYRYGSDLLTVTFDPTRPDQFASYGFDDDGLPACKQVLIRNGLLERGLGGVISQARSGIPGVANSRASNWNRPPIDRMANLNVEPGAASMDELLAAVESGVYMETNRSWSIDDSRNKFQFGCEYARRIENGRLGEVLKNPNYRGISATFWRNLKGLGDASTFGVFGTPYCGKGEPNQIMRVGHASPACLFADVEVFGGA